MKRCSDRRWCHRLSRRPELCNGDPRGEAEERTPTNRHPPRSSRRPLAYRPRSRFREARHEPGRWRRVTSNGWSFRRQPEVFHPHSEQAPQGPSRARKPHHKSRRSGREHRHNGPNNWAGKPRPRNAPPCRMYPSHRWATRRSTIHPIVHTVGTSRQRTECQQHIDWGKYRRNRLLLHSGSNTPADIGRRRRRRHRPLRPSRWLRSKVARSGHTQDSCSERTPGRWGKPRDRSRRTHRLPHRIFHYIQAYMTRRHTARRDTRPLSCRSRPRNKAVRWHHT
jgi:hypothetical protein